MNWHEPPSCCDPSKSRIRQREIEDDCLEERDKGVMQAKERMK
jgi:hypothetical protein